MAETAIRGRGSWRGSSRTPHRRSRDRSGGPPRESRSGSLPAGFAPSLQACLVGRDGRLRASIRLGIVRRSRKARSSVVEHHVDIVGVGGSIPLAPTMSRTRIRRHVLPGSVAHPHPAAWPGLRSFTQRRRLALPRGDGPHGGEGIPDSGGGEPESGDMRRSHGLKMTLRALPEPA